MDSGQQIARRTNELWRQSAPESCERRMEPALACHVAKRTSRLDQHVVKTTRITIVQVVFIIYLHQSNCINANIMNILLPTLISQTQMLAVIPKLLFYLDTTINMIELLIGHKCLAKIGTTSHIIQPFSNDVIEGSWTFSQCCSTNFMIVLMP